MQIYGGLTSVPSHQATITHRLRQALIMYEHVLSYICINVYYT